MPASFVKRLGRGWQGTESLGNFTQQKANVLRLNLYKDKVNYDDLEVAKRYMRGEQIRYELKRKWRPQ